MAGALGSRLAAYRQKAHMTQEQVAAALGIVRGSVAQWETNRSTPTMQHLSRLAGLYNTTPNELLGVPTEARIPTNMVEVPIVGEIPAGRLVFNADTVVGHRSMEPGRVAGAVHFLLRVDGNCMWPRFHDGDYALVRMQDEVENGDIAIVSVEGQATMKRYRRRGSTVALSADHPEGLADPAADPMLVPASKVRVIGKVVGGEWD